MGLECAIVANRPMNAQVCWVRAGEEVCVTINGKETEISAALRDLFTEVMNLENGERIARNTLIQIWEIVRERDKK